MCDKDRSLAGSHRVIGRCLTGLQKYDDAWKCFQQSLKIIKNTTLDEINDIRNAHTFNCMGECLIGKQQYAEALVYLQKARKIYQFHSNWENDPYFAEVLNNLGICLIELQEYADALNRLKESSKIYEKFKSNKHIASKITCIHSKIDEILQKHGHLLSDEHKLNTT